MLLVVYLVSVLIAVACEPRVIVIGSGPAGIAATSKLLEQNVNVQVLEAEPRIGGRVNSVYFGEAFVELGAEWCHGEVDNVVYELVKDRNILGHSDFHFRFYSSDGKDVDEQFSYDLHNLFDQIYTPDGNKKQDEGITVGEYFIKKYNTSIRDIYATQPDKLEFALNALECFHHYVLSSEGAFSWFDTAATNDYRDCEGDLNLHWNGKGYKTIFDILLKTYPQNTTHYDFIKTNHEVMNIEWMQKEGNFRVKCRNGLQLAADYVIFTPSLGVLKHRHNSLFTPSLPTEKMKVIRDLGIAAVAKVMLHFPKRWWPLNNFTGYSFVWLPHDKEMVLAEFPYGPSKDGRSWLLEFTGLFPVENNPNVLSAWFTGNMVPEIEKTSDNIITNGIEFMLNKFLGHKYNVSHPDSILRTNWYSNNHFRGTYSYQTIQSRKIKPSSHLVLSEPIYDNTGAPRLLFAGEATHPKYYSTVHGAIESGFREANRLINHFKENQII